MTKKYTVNEKVYSRDFMNMIIKLSISGVITSAAISGSVLTITATNEEDFHMLENILYYD